MNKRIIIGLVGYPASGKDTAALYLWQEHGFVHVSTGDYVREHIKKNHLGEPTRELMHTVSNELRHVYGAGYFAKLAIENSEDKEKIILSGIRTVGEALEIKKHSGYIIAIYVSQNVRFERAKARGLSRDNIDFEAFKAIEELEAQNTDPNSQNVMGVINMADYRILNEDTMGNLHRQIDEIVNQISPRAL